MANLYLKTMNFFIIMVVYSSTTVTAVMNSSNIWARNSYSLIEANIIQLKTVKYVLPLS